MNCITLYSNHDGEGSISFDAKESRLHITNQVELRTASILIGPAGLRALADALEAVAVAMEGEQ